MAKKKLPPDVLAFFRKQGAIGGKIGGKRSLETMSPEERRKRALAGVAGRQAKRNASKPKP